jgi:hypothetical protein
MSNAAPPFCFFLDRLAFINLLPFFDLLPILIINDKILLSIKYKYCRQVPFGEYSIVGHMTLRKQVHATTEVKYLAVLGGNVFYSVLHTYQLPLPLLDLG